ncbi:hypothetical protein AgCh_005987 [Apium graveolens]
MLIENTMHIKHCTQKNYYLQTYIPLLVTVTKMNGDCSGIRKSSWPELLGVYGKVAAAIISRNNPNLGVQIIKEGTVVSAQDYRCDRVRVWVNNFGIVTLVPRVG